MLFTSYVFLIGFLPITLLVYVFLSRFEWFRLAKGWLVFASLFFYGWWDARYLVLLGVSLLVNYFLGKRLLRAPSRLLLIFGLTFNLGALFYFKYSSFFVQTLNQVSGAGWIVPHIILPLGISFFTFQKVAFLVDAYQGKVKSLSFLNYCLFVTFFPQLIAGPIVHHSEIMPQFDDSRDLRVKLPNFSLGFTLFIFGLFKKLVFADWAAIYSDEVFDEAKMHSLSFAQAWFGALAYTVQIYFDFSGYSDMALGLARMFNIALPINFNSPYKATSIADFWRRWHMSLSRFLRDYLYIPLGGNRRGKFRQKMNLMITMVLGGFWHGASWNFLIWGFLHGFYLMVNHAWTESRFSRLTSGVAGTLFSRALTLFAVMMAWVFFRADGFYAAKNVFYGMVHPGTEAGYVGKYLRVSFFLLLGWALLAKNTNEVFGLNGEEKIWKPNLKWAFLTGLMIIMIVYGLNRKSPFIYFQF